MVFFFSDGWKKPRGQGKRRPPALVSANLYEKTQRSQAQWETKDDLSHGCEVVLFPYLKLKKIHMYFSILLFVFGCVRS